MAKDLAQQLRENGWTQQRLADSLNVTPGAVWQWMQKRVPAERVLDVEKATGIPRHELRPDIYPHEAAA